MHTIDPHKSATHNGRVLDRLKMPLFWEVKDIGKKAEIFFKLSVTDYYLLSSGKTFVNYDEQYSRIFLEKLKRVPQKVAPFGHCIPLL